MQQIQWRRSRGRLTAGIILLIVGVIFMAIELGIELPHDWWKHWPWLLVAMGAIQVSWPGSPRERLSGYWLLAVGGWGLINVYRWFGLDWGNSWPLLIIAAGLRIVLGGFLKRDDKRGEPRADTQIK